MNAPYSERRIISVQHMLLVVAAILFLVLLWRNTPYQRGMADSCIDNCLGCHEVREYGHNRWFLELLHERYDMKAQVVPDLTDADDCLYADGYNDVSRWFAARRFCKDVFAECEADGEKLEVHIHDGGWRQ